MPSTPASKSTQSAKKTPAKPAAQPAKKTVALVLGGGAPNATLMAGALDAFIDHNVQFDIISTAGAGALVGLFYAVPKHTDAQTALKSLVNMGIDDAIYQFFPINYKVFNKPGNLADLWRQINSHNPLLQKLQQSSAPAERYLADWWQLILATFCPSDLSSESKGLCAHVPFIDEFVDFDALKSIKPHFYLNSYNLSRHQMACWDKRTIQREHFLAALSFPFIYPPYELNGEYYIEGAAIDTLNFKGLFKLHRHIDTVVVFDVLGCEKILHPPHNLYDAWVQSMITPLTEIARDDLKLFASQYIIDPATQKPRCKLLHVEYEDFLSDKDYAYELEWSYSNLSHLYSIGQQAGHAFCQRHAPQLNLKS